jgi:hypothetical protein
MLFSIVLMTSNAQETNKEVVVKKIFEAVKNKDEKAFLHLFPTPQGTRDFIRDIVMKSAPADDSAKARLMADSLLFGMTDSMINSEMKRDFSRYIKKGEAKSIDWSKAVLVSFTADSVMTNETEMITAALSGKIYFNVGATEYYMSYDQVLWFAGKGWYGVNIKRIDEKAKESDEEDADDFNEDQAPARKPE